MCVPMEVPDCGKPDRGLWLVLLKEIFANQKKFCLLKFKRLLEF